jgi:hypothetical protein
MAVGKHIHKLKKHKYKSSNAVFFCILDCSYKIEVPFALGKEVLCYLCNKPFTMNELSLKLNMPHCNNCGKREVRDANGKKHYVRKVNTQVLSNVAEDNNSSLRERLSKVSSNSVEEDI